MTRVTYYRTVSMTYMEIFYRQPDRVVQRISHAVVKPPGGTKPNWKDKRIEWLVGRE